MFRSLPSSESQIGVVVSNNSNVASLPISACFHRFSENSSIEPSSNYLLTKFERKIIIGSEMVTRNMKRTYDLLEGLYD